MHGSSQPGRPVVCLGEALVDLVCQRPATSLGEAGAFVPRLGGSIANIAVAAARFGADVSLAGAAGDDGWAEWLATRLRGDGIALNHLVTVSGSSTSLAFVTVSEEREPGFAFHGDERRAAALADLDLDVVLAGEPGVLVLGSDTLVGAAERAVTLRAGRLARERGWEVACDPNLRPNRWASEEEMLGAIGELVALASVVKLTDSEATHLTGETEPGAAARALAREGATVIVTRGAEGALLASGDTVESVDAQPVERPVDATGAGDAVAGVLAAALATGLSPAELGAALPGAMAAAAGVVGAWGATEGLPPPDAARATLARALP